MPKLSPVAFPSHAADDPPDSRFHSAVQDQAEDTERPCGFVGLLVALHDVNGKEITAATQHRPKVLNWPGFYAHKFIEVLHPFGKPISASPREALWLVAP